MENVFHLTNLGNQPIVIHSFQQLNLSRLSPTQAGADPELLLGGGANP